MVAEPSFGQWLKQRRKRLDLTQDELAARIGCAAITIYKIEAGERRPSKQIAELLAGHLNIPNDDYPEFIRFARSEGERVNAPWGTPFHPPTNLPMQPSTLIGRANDLAQVRKRLVQPETRLITLIGAPGIGKTRLALETAVQSLDEFVDGVFLIALAPVTDPDAVSGVIASVLGIQEGGSQIPLERLKSFLREKQLLLLLDNFEQILAAASQIVDLLASCLWLKILVTSRAPLRIRHEHQIPVPPLTLPDFSGVFDTASLSQSAAVELLVERTQAVKPDFSLTEENAPTVAALCARLDGLPLAIELISARLKILPLKSLLDQLHGRLLLQSDGMSDIEPRHRTLNNAIGWSYQLLSEPEQAFFRRLGIFASGWTLTAAESICVVDLPLNTLDALTALLDKNLVKQMVSSDEPRYTMLETIREYALDQLAVQHEDNAIRRSHAEYYLLLAQRFEAGLNSSEGLLWLRQIEHEHLEIQSALRWCIEEDVALAMRICIAISPLWEERGYFNEGRQFLEQVLRIGDDSPLELRALVLRAFGSIVCEQGDYPLAERTLSESLEAFRQIEAWREVGLTLLQLSRLLILQGKRSTYPQAQALAEESLRILQVHGTEIDLARPLRQLGNFAVEAKEYLKAESLYREALRIEQECLGRWATSSTLHNLAILAIRQKQVAQAKLLYQESLDIARDNHDPVGVANTLNSLANIAQLEGDYEAAERLREEALGLFRDLNASVDAELQLTELGYIAVKKGEYTRARFILEKSLRKWLILGNREQIIWVIRYFAVLARAQGYLSAAIRLYAAVDHLKLFFEPLNRDLIDSEIDEIQRMSSQESFRDLWTAGSQMTLEQAVGEALVTWK